MGFDPRAGDGLPLHQVHDLLTGQRAHQTPGGVRLQGEGGRGRRHSGILEELAEGADGTLAALRR